MEMGMVWQAALVVAASLAVTGVAWSHNDPNSPVGQCIQDAVQTRQSCTQTCRDDFQASVDTCRNLNPSCAEAAREARQTCVQSVFTSLQQCIAENCATPQPTPHWRGQGDDGEGDGQGECDGDGGLGNFQCREQCRQTVDVMGGLTACRDAFRTAISQCPVPTPTSTSSKKKR